MHHQVKIKRKLDYRELRERQKTRFSLRAFANVKEMYYSFHVLLE